MKAIEHYFLPLPFVMLYKVVLTFHSVDKTPLCDHSNQSYCVVVLVLLFIMPHKVVLTFCPVDKTIARPLK